MGEGLILLVGGDLNARTRVGDAAARAGYAFGHTAPATFLEALRSAAPEVLVLDLDDGRTGVLGDLAAARAEGLVPSRTHAYLSHVDEQLAAAAREAGLDPLPRGRFWRSLDDLLGQRPTA